MSEEVSKLKVIATNKNLLPSERIEAADTLAVLGDRDALLALLDIAADEGLLPSERGFALSKAREVIRSRGT